MTNGVWRTALSSDWGVVAVAFAKSNFFEITCDGSSLTMNLRELHKGDDIVEGVRVKNGFLTLQLVSHVWLFGQVWFLKLKAGEGRGVTDIISQNPRLAVESLRFQRISSQ